MLDKGNKVRRTRKLKVAHIVPCTAHLAGMYETARDLVAAECKLGINAMIVDPRPDERIARKHKAITKTKEIKCPDCGKEIKLIEKQEQISPRPPAFSSDRGVCIADQNWAKTCDLIVSHSGVPEGSDLDKLNVPRIHVAHGRPNSSYRIERSGSSPIYSMYKKMAEDDRWKVMVTLWPGYEDYWKLIFPDVRQLSPFVDLDYWQRQDTDYDFDGKKGNINVVIADIWRLDKDPFHVLNAFVLFAERHEGAKLHIYGIDMNGRGRDVLFDALDDRGILGEVKPIVGHLREVYSAADMLITPHTIATRTVREALACGLNVVAGSRNPYTPYNACPEALKDFSKEMDVSWDDWQKDKENCVNSNRRKAEVEFDAMRTAQQFVDLFGEVLQSVAEGTEEAA